MDKFAFIIHPIDPKRDVARKFPRLSKLFTENQINFLCTFFPPIYISEITGIISQYSGKEISGWLLACPYTPRRMLELPVQTVYRKIVKTGQLAEKLGANMLGFGAYTSVVGDGGITIANQLTIPVTTGDALTVAMAVEALEVAAQKIDLDIRHATAAVVGATGAIGKLCAELLSEKAQKLILLGKQEAKLFMLSNQLTKMGVRAQIEISTSIRSLLNANVVLSATNATGAIIKSEDLRAGSIICDLAMPRDVSSEVARMRNDVLVLDGGIVEVPGSPCFKFDFGLPPGNVYACMAETIALTLEGRLEDFSLGKQISRDQVNEISMIAHKHGLKIGDFRSFERTVNEERFATVKANGMRSVQIPVASLEERI